MDKNSQQIKQSAKMNCILCAGTAELRTTEQKGYVEPDIFSIYHCYDCNTAFSIPRIDASIIYDLIYQAGSKVPGYDRYWNFAKMVKKKKKPLKYLANKEEAYWGIEQVLNKMLHIDKNAKILEIGSGLGYLTYSLIKDGFVNTKGIDISQEAVDNANTRYGNFYIQADILEYSKSHSNEFDVIILTEVIEHIEEPLKFLNSLKNLIKNTGIVILTTPNKSFFSKETIWQTDPPPVHCWWFSEDSINFFAKKLNMQPNFVDFKSFKIQRYVLKNRELGYVFNKNKQLNEKKNEGFLPKWLKETKLYRDFLIKSKIYQFLLVSIDGKKYIKTKNISSTLCAYLTK